MYVRMHRYVDPHNFDLSATWLKDAHNTLRLCIATNTTFIYYIQYIIQAFRNVEHIHNTPHFRNRWQYKVQIIHHQQHALSTLRWPLRPRPHTHSCSAVQIAQLVTNHGSSSTSATDGLWLRGASHMAVITACHHGHNGGTCCIEHEKRCRSMRCCFCWRNTDVGSATSPPGWNWLVFTFHIVLNYVSSCCCKCFLWLLYCTAYANNTSQAMNA